MTNTFSYEYIPEVNTFAVFQTVVRDGKTITRPVAEYFTEKSARSYVEKVNARIKDRSLPIVPCRAPIQYRFQLPDWWLDRNNPCVQVK